MTQFDLHQQDCIKGMARLKDETVDLVVTSPPYNLGVRYGKYSDRQDRQSYLCWCREWAAGVRVILKSSGYLFLNIGSAPSNPMLPHQLVMELCNLFVLQNTIHWIKSITIEDREAVVRSYGHFKPISSKRFVNDCHEHVFHFTKTGRVELDRLAIGVPYQDKTNIARWAHTRGSDLRCRGNTWYSRSGVGKSLRHALGGSSREVATSEAPASVLLRGVRPQGPGSACAAGRRVASVNSPGGQRR